MDGQKDDFKWFGEGFDGFPKRLPEDTVEYMIYIIDTKRGDAQVRSRLNDVLQAANDLTKKLLKGYIWQREDFKPSLKREGNSWLLHGRTNYGDSVADEWLIVYMLRELSKQFSDAWIRVYDTDGEFLLVEAANALPKWLNPEIAENRVWVNRGHLRIVPLDKNASTLRNVSINQALEALTSDPSSLIESPLIEEEAFYRIQTFPKAISESLHYSKVTIPRKLVYILHRNPSYISPAIEAFYVRDPISLRPLQQSSRSELKFPPEDFVTVSICFNKVSFAQVKSQDFPLPRSWEGLKLQSAANEETPRKEVGMRMTCGFEMLLQDPQNQDKKAVREIALLLEDLETGDDALPSNRDIASWPSREDSESWLDINFEDFENELAGKRGESVGQIGRGGFGDKAAQENLRKMVERFEQFMNDEDAGPEGAELDDMDFDDDEDALESEDEDEDRDVSFDEREFSRMMREMMGMPAEDETRSTSQCVDSGLARFGEVDEEIDNTDEDEEIRKLSERMEAELNATGALDLNPTPSKLKAINGGKGKGKALIESDKLYNEDETSEEGEEDGEVSVDFNLAKNMLAAFQGQMGTAGPAGNMIGLMGLQVPRGQADYGSSNSRPS